MRGTIPPLLAGTLYRTGPGRSSIPDAINGGYTCDHWFDGYTCVHRFQIIPTSGQSCRVWYNSRHQSDEVVERIRKTGNFDGFTFGQKRDPCMSFFQKLKAAFDPRLIYADGLKVPEIGVALAYEPPDWAGDVNEEKSGRLVARTDAAVTTGMDPETLEPTCDLHWQHRLHPSLTGWMSSTHPQVDPLTGDTYSYNLSFTIPCTYRVFVTSKATGTTTILASVWGLDIRPAYLHSFFLTPDFVILCLWGSFFAAGGAKVIWEKNLLDAISPFDPKARTTWLIVDRKHDRGLVAKFDSPAMFAFHTVNAWQEPGQEGTTDIYCDLIQYPSLDVLHRFYYDNLRSSGRGVHKWAGSGIDRSSQKPCLARYRLSKVPLTGEKTGDRPPKLPVKGTAERILELLTPLVGDLPVINEHMKFKKQRYLYTLVDRGLSSFVDGIAKLDIDTQQVKYWSRPHHTPGEVMFFPRSAGKRMENREDEDDGYLASVILDGDQGRSYLLCLDAKTMEEVGRAEMEVAVGIGFHGLHIT